MSCIAMYTSEECYFQQGGTHLPGK